MARNTAHKYLANQPVVFARRLNNQLMIEPMILSRAAAALPASLARILPRASKYFFHPFLKPTLDCQRTGGWWNTACSTSYDKQQSADSHSDCRDYTRNCYALFSKILAPAKAGLAVSRLSLSSSFARTSLTSPRFRRFSIVLPKTELFISL